MYLFCGLGNPGNKFINTRHNIGFLLIENLISNYNFKLIKRDNQKELYEGCIGRQECFLLKPQTFMNLSGSVIYKVKNYYKINKTQIYVIHDDIDLNLAKVKIKIGGGNAGHIGLESIDRYIGKI